MQPLLKFLHCMQKIEYLESALTSGLMFTEHKVEFKPTNDNVEFKNLILELMPYLERRLTSIGRPLIALSEERKGVIFSGIGSISGNIPMLCFTEIPEGRNISNHILSFGGYGLVVRREWLEKNRADRVLYVGENSTVSRNLFRNLSLLRISNIVACNIHQVLFDTTNLPALLDLIAHVETRLNLEEFEWRIAGNHGFMGVQKDTGKKLVIKLDYIEYILVKEKKDISHIESLVKKLSVSQGSISPPKVLYQPTVIPI